MTVTALAVDLGSSSGRVIAGVLDDDRITETEVHRFPHTAAMRDGYLCWDLDLIRQEMIKGLQLAVERFPDAASVSIDTWGVDWVALGADGEPSPRDAATATNAPAAPSLPSGRDCPTRRHGN